VPGLTKEIKQDSGEGDAEGRGKNGGGLRVKRMLEGVSENVKAEEQEERG
jgi:hypothetical protein